MKGGIDMTQEEKELLLKDLCARLPYGVKFACNKNIYTATGLELIVTDEGNWEYAITEKNIAPIEINYIKPYLFPLSSMTEEQRVEYQLLMDCVSTYDYDYGALIEEIKLCDNWRSIDYLNTYHFDYRGLIEKGLAIDATGLNIY